MSRFERGLRALIVVTATVLVTEWVHYQVGDETLWWVLRSESKRDLPAISGDLDAFSVTEGEFERYLEVLERMQGNHGLSVEEAARSSGLSVDVFRDIEKRVQRSAVFVERTRERLRQEAERLWDSRQQAPERG